jgi:hypothetical protein
MSCDQSLRQVKRGAVGEGEILALVFVQVDALDITGKHRA